MDVQLNKIMVRLGIDDKPLFRITDFKVDAGAKIFISGPSGCGKTTLLHLLAGLFDPNDGTVRVGPHKLHELSDNQRCLMRRESMGLIFQKLNLLSHLTADENIQLSTSSRSDIQKREVITKKLGISHCGNRLVSTLSLGEQQRTAVARVLYSSPQIILADEPTSSLDEKNALEVALSILNTEATVIVVSHDQRIRPLFKTVYEFKDIVNQ